MDMQDKEFDESFRSKLDDFEMEPSAKVWSGIDDELRSAGRRKLLMPWLGIAASIIVLATMGVLFMPKQTVKHTKVFKQGTIAKVIQPVSTVHASPTPLQAFHSPSVKKIRVIQAIAIIKKKDEKTIEPEKKVSQLVTTPGPVNKSVLEAMANVIQKQTSTEAVVPDKTTALTPTVSAEPAQGFTLKPALAANQEPDVSKKDSIPAKSKHKIHGFAGLVSMVIAKVDKHKEKLNPVGDDDDESNIVGVNLGIVKIKKGE